MNIRIAIVKSLRTLSDTTLNRLIKEFEREREYELLTAALAERERRNAKISSARIVLSR
jgi:hypothetical protein